MYRVRYAVLAEGDEVPPLAQWRDAVVGGIDAARRLGGTDATSLATFDGDEEVALTGSSAEEVFFQFLFACERRGSTPGLLLRVLRRDEQPAGRLPAAAADASVEAWVRRARLVWRLVCIHKVNISDVPGAVREVADHVGAATPVGACATSCCGAS